MAQVNLLVLYLHLEGGKKVNRDIRINTFLKKFRKTRAVFPVSFQNKPGCLKVTVNCSVPWRIQRTPKTMVTFIHTFQVLI